jgi:hypothetical protein
MASLLASNPAVPTCRARLSADESAALLTRKLRAWEPFFYLRYGDGAIECMKGTQGRTCDGERYSQGLGTELRAAFDMLRVCDSFHGLRPRPILCLGDWLTASFDYDMEHTRYAGEYAELIGDLKPHYWLHFEALLLMRESEALADFYRAVARSSRQKLYMGPASHAPAARLLNADHLVTPMQELFSYVDQLTEELTRRRFDVLLYGAGMAGNIPVIRAWRYFPERTYIHLGSAFDVLCLGKKTRRQQLAPNRARALLQDLL